MVGINLLREGCDFPEFALVAIVDADKEGFLRSEPSLVRTVAAPPATPTAASSCTADHVTGSMERAIAETDRRREKQTAYNLAQRDHPGDHPPQRPTTCCTASSRANTDQARITARVEKPLVGANLAAHLDALRRDMLKAAENLEFEEAARIRDEVRRLETVDLAVHDDPLARQSAIDAEVDAALPRSKAGRGGTRTYRGKSQKRMR